MAYIAPSTRTTGTLITAAIWNQDVVANPIALRAGEISVTSQAAGDLLVAASATQLERLIGSSKTGNLQDAILQRAELKDYSETVTTPTISAGALTLNYELGNIFYVASFNANVTTLTLSNPPASGRLGSIVLMLNGDGTVRTITWPASVKWAGGTGPTFTGTLNKVDIVTFFTRDAGTTWFASVLGLNF